MTWIVSAFIKDLQDKSSTHWSLVVTLLLMVFARSRVYEIIPADAFLRGMISQPDVQDLMVIELFAFLGAGILLFVIFTIAFEFIFNGWLPKKIIPMKKRKK